MRKREGMVKGKEVYGIRQMCEGVERSELSGFSGCTKLCQSERELSVLSFHVLLSVCLRRGNQKDQISY